jgi:SLOG-like protein
VTPTARPPPVIGVSISDPPDEELVALGMSPMHLRHTFIEVVRHALVAGWSVAYGGDLRHAGYTEALFDLVRMYDHPDVTGPERVTNYLAWPLWVGRTAEDDVELANVATLVKCPAPSGAPKAIPPVEESAPFELLVRSQALTRMRVDMTGAIDSRLVLGGRVSGQVGLLPGVLEEVVLAVDAGLPLYVAGGFGGCARAVAAALRGERPVELTHDHQLANTPRYAELFDAAHTQSIQPALDRVVEHLASIGLTGLRNGLDDADNRRLSISDDTEEVTTLVLRGMHQLFGSTTR